jgi:hypothetical protein
MTKDRIPVRALSRVSICMSIVIAFLSCPNASRAQENAQEKEPVAVIQLGGGSEWAFNGGSSFGPSAAVEFTAVKNWLEVEAGVTSLFRRGQSEWDSGVVFKKPFDLSPSVEFEPGIGPVWMHTVSAGRTADSLGAELAFEFMIWPTRDRKYGWFVEPGYSTSFGKDHEKSLGVNGGLLIAIW